MTGHAIYPAGRLRRLALVSAYLVSKYQAGNDIAAAKKTVAALIDQFGFDVVAAGPLGEGRRIQRDAPGYGPRRTVEQIRGDLAAAKRYSEMHRPS